jgi:hypothetical protein
MSCLFTLPIEIVCDVGLIISIFEVLDRTLVEIPQTLREDVVVAFVILVVLWSRASVVH